MFNTASYFDVQTNPAIGERGLINIYLPEGKGPFPFILGIHGGGWCAGDRKSYNHFWPRVKQAGLAFVLCSYRICQEDYYPAAYNDLVRLLKWLRNHAPEFNLDPERCSLLGGSAGAHLVMLLATKATKKESGLCNIRAVVDYCGIMDLLGQYEHDNARGHTMTFAFMGGNPARKPENYHDASPVNHIHGKMPSVWMAHGTDDKVVLIEQSRNMASLLRAAGSKVSFTEAPGRAHTLVKDDNAPIDQVEFLFEDEMFEFLKSHLSDLAPAL